MCFLRLNIYRYSSIARVDLSVTDLLFDLIHPKLRHIPRHTVKFHYMTAFRDSARIFRTRIIGYIEVFCNFSVVDCDLLQLQQRLLLPYLWETTDAWSLRQLQLASSETAFSFPRWLVGLVTLYISDERWAEITLRDWEIASLSQCWAQTGCIEPNSAFKN